MNGFRFTYWSKLIFCLFIYHVCSRYHVEITMMSKSVKRADEFQPEHTLAVRYNQTTSALYKHHLDTEHKIYFDKRKQIASIQHHTSRLIREAIETEKTVSKNKREDVQNLSTVWKTTIWKSKPSTRTQTSKKPKPINRDGTPQSSEPIIHTKGRKYEQFYADTCLQRSVVSL